MLIVSVLFIAVACSSYESVEDPSEESDYSGDDSDSLGSDILLEDERPAGTGLTFHGYPCRIDCSGHEAGYEWAEERGITDPDDCGGNSESFIEGCRAYAGDEGPGGWADEDEEGPREDEEAEDEDEGEEE